jgi:hypothetical protein
LNRRSAWRCLVAAGFAIATMEIALRPIGGGSHQGPVAFHLALAAVLIVGAAFDDRLGRFLRTTGAAMALAGPLVAIGGPFEQTGMISSWMVEVYPLVMMTLIAVYGYYLGHRPSLAGASLILFFWLAVTGCRGYVCLRKTVGGLDYIAIGMLLLGLAVLTSMAKGGALPWKIGDRKREVSNAGN